MYSPDDLPLELEYDIIDVIKTMPDGYETYKYTPLGISFYGPDLIYVYLDKVQKKDKDKIGHTILIKSDDAEGDEEEYAHYVE